MTEAQWADLVHFDGNANAFRLLAHQFRGRRPGGFVMTYSTLASIVKYPYPATEATIQKFGYFVQEQNTFDKIAEHLGLIRQGKGWCRHPLAYLVEAADDICYEIMDIEDSHKLKILSFDETAELLLAFFDERTQNGIRKRIIEEGMTDRNEMIVYMRACAIGKLENECVKAFIENEDAILNGSFQGSLIQHISEQQRNAYQHCTEVSMEKIYRSKPVLDVELAGYKIMETLMDQMTEAVLHPDRYYSQQLICRVSSQYDIHAADLESRIMAVLDYISGMTDVYALDVYQKINGISLPIV